MDDPGEPAEIEARLVIPASPGVEVAVEATANALLLQALESLQDVLSWHGLSIVAATIACANAVERVAFDS
jgi:hypothetical protein